MNSFVRKTGAALILSAGILVSSPAQTEKAPPKELLQYVYDAKGRKVGEAKIKRDAVAAGWPPSIVDEAITYAQKGKQPQAVVPGTASSSAAIAPAQPVAPNSGSTTGTPSSQLPVQADSNPAASQSQSTDSNPIPAVRARVPDDYVIGSGDVLQISVWKEPEVSVPSIVVRPGGMITLPLIKDVEVEGVTRSQAERVIADRLVDFINAPNVTVIVTASNSKKIYVIGAVSKEGPLPYTYRMTVMQALSEAGGLTEFAKRKKIYIVRSERGVDYRLDFNYDEVIKGERMGQNIYLQPGDSLVIPQ